MKSRNLWATLIFGIFIYVPAQSFSQIQSPNILDSLPTNFKYQIYTDSFPYHDVYRSMQLYYFKNEMTLGCFNPVEAQLAFSLTISHPFLLETYNDFIPANFIVYAVKKSEILPDTTIIKALDEYCTYGQMNYYFQSRDFVLFLYATYTNSQGRVERLAQTSFWNQIENQLIKNLDLDYPVIAEVQEIIQVDNELLKPNIIRGKYQLCSRGLPHKRITRANGEEIHISGMPDNCNFTVKLKRNNKAKAVYILDGKKQFKKNWKWFIDAQYVYLDRRDGQGLHVYKMVNEHQMVSFTNNKYGGGYLQKLNR